MSVLDLPFTEETVGWATMGDGEIGNGKAEREGRVVYRTAQAAWHPVHPVHPVNSVMTLAEGATPRGQCGRWSRSGAGEDRMTG